MAKFKCIVCGKTYKTQKGLDVHMATKHEVQIFNCSVCGKSFDNEEMLDLHMRATHQDNALPKEEKVNVLVDDEYTCNKCGKKYNTKRGVEECLYKHKVRESRTPLGVPKRKLSYDVPEGMVGRIRNDVGNRLQDALKAGYRFVEGGEAVLGQDVVDGNTDLGGYVSTEVGTTEKGEPIKGYLMVIDKDLYDEAQAEKMAEVDKRDVLIRNGKNETNLDGKGYIPSSGITLN